MNAVFTPSFFCCFIVKPSNWLNATNHIMCHVVIVVTLWSHSPSPDSSCVMWQVLGTPIPGGNWFPLLTHPLGFYNSREENKRRMTSLDVVPVFFFPPHYKTSLPPPCGLLWSKMILFKLVESTKHTTNKSKLRWIRLSLAVCGLNIKHLAADFWYLKSQSCSSPFVFTCDRDEIYLKTERQAWESVAVAFSIWFLGVFPEVTLQFCGFLFQWNLVWKLSGML